MILGGAYYADRDHRFASQLGARLPMEGAARIMKEYGVGRLRMVKGSNSRSCRQWMSMASDSTGSSIL